MPAQVVRDAPLVGGGLYTPGTPVIGADGPIGTLVGVQPDAAGGTQERLLVRVPRRLRFFGVTRMVPAAWVERAGPDRIVLAAGRAAVAQCPPARTDEAIRGDVLDALSRLDLPRAFRAGVRLDVRDGVVHLSGNVRTPAHARLLVDAAGAVPGALGIRNGLVDDESLTFRVAQALTAHPTVRRAHLRVDSRLGRVGLSGALPSEAARGTATTLATSVPGVSGVRNHAAVPVDAARP
jgi:osmotically-inducible protein OsmY